MTSGWSNGGTSVAPVSRRVRRPPPRAAPLRTTPPGRRGARVCAHLRSRGVSSGITYGRVDAEPGVPRVSDRLARGCRWSTRRHRAAGAPASIRPTALSAPRTLNAPITCRLSGLIHSGRSASAQGCRDERRTHDIAAQPIAAALISSTETRVGALIRISVAAEITVRCWRWQRSWCMVTAVSSLKIVPRYAGDRSAGRGVQRALF